MALSSILPPGYRAFKAVQQQNEQSDLAELQKAQVVQGLLAKMQAQKQQQAYQAALGALPPDASPEQHVTAARPFLGPEKMVELTGREEDRKQKSIDRKDAATQRAFEVTMAFDQKQQELDRRKDVDLQRTTDANAKLAMEERYKQDTLRLQQERALWERQFKQQGLDIQKMLAERREEGAPVAVVGPDGKPVLVSRKDAIGKTPVAAEKPMNEFQGKSSLYGTRAAQSDKILRELEDKISTTGLAVKQAIQGMPVLGGPLGAAANVALSTEQQRVEQAQRDFVNAVLRQESGAVISDAEFENAKKQYFPAPGDDKETKDQKRANRALAIDGFKRMAGRGGEDIEALRAAPLLPGGGGGDLKAKVEAAGIPYEPDKFEYRVQDGKVQRRARGR